MNGIQVREWVVFFVFFRPTEILLLCFSPKDGLASVLFREPAGPELATLTCPCGSGPELAALGLGPLLWACACDSGFVFLRLWAWGRGPGLANLDPSVRPWTWACDPGPKRATCCLTWCERPMTPNHGHREPARLVVCGNHRVNAGARPTLRLLRHAWLAWLGSLCFFPLAWLPSRAPTGPRGLVSWL